MFTVFQRRLVTECLTGRWFLDRIATHILAFEGDSQVVFFDGNYSEYEANKTMRLDDVEPKRFKYKKLME